MVDAIDKMFDFIELKKWTYDTSFPDLAYQVFMNCPNANFSLFEEEDKHLYYMLKNNIRGGPSIIFNSPRAPSD